MKGRPVTVFHFVEEKVRNKKGSITASKKVRKEHYRGTFVDFGIDYFEGNIGAASITVAIVENEKVLKLVPFHLIEFETEVHS